MQEGREIFLKVARIESVELGIDFESIRFLDA